MVIEDNLKKIIKNYNLKIVKESLNDNVFNLTLSDKKTEALSLTIQYKDDRILAVYFLNNQFYELTDSDLYLCIAKILSGKYSTRKALIGSRNSIIVEAGKGRKKIVPERIESDAEYKETYKLLPRAFSKLRSDRLTTSHDEA